MGAQDGETALMRAAQEKADGVAKLLIEAKADLDAKNEVRPVGMCIRIFCAVAGCCRSLPWHADVTHHLHHHRRDRRRDCARSMDARR